MLQHCKYSSELWEKVNDWIIEIGMDNYKLSDMEKVEGDLENALAINSILL